MTRKILAKLKFVNRLKFNVYADVILLLGTCYLVVKKLKDFSLTGWLVNNVLHQNAVNNLVFALIMVIVLSVIIKIISMLLEAFPPEDATIVEPEQISHCLQVINSEIVQHISRLESGGDKPLLRKLNEQHNFDVNTRMIVDGLASHIKESVAISKLKNKDIFISLYNYSEDSKCLTYELHYDPKRDNVNSMEIPLEGKNSKRYTEYECVKCMKSSANTAYVLSNKDYAKCTNKRFKTIKQYMGCKLESSKGNVFAFLNIEIHNHAVFDSEENMRDFMETSIFPFKLLLEYQYLKRKFFNSFADLDGNWEIENGKQNQDKS